jgi:hypothetical protein
LPHAKGRKRPTHRIRLLARRNPPQLCVLRSARDDPVRLPGDPQRPTGNLRPVAVPTLRDERRAELGLLQTARGNGKAKPMTLHEYSARPRAIWFHRQSGETYAAIGERYGVTAERARQIIASYERAHRRHLNHLRFFARKVCDPMDEVF